MTLAGVIRHQPLDVEDVLIAAVGVVTDLPLDHVARGERRATAGEEGEDREEREPEDARRVHEPKLP
jgi:hypothetical protein